MNNKKLALAAFGLLAFGFLLGKATSGPEVWCEDLGGQIVKVEATQDALVLFDKESNGLLLVAPTKAKKDLLSLGKKVSCN